MFRSLRLWGIAAAALFWMGSLVAEAELLVYEPFDYPAGANLDGLVATGRNLSGSYSTSSIQDLVIASPGLTYGNLLKWRPAVAGNRLNDENGAGQGTVTVSLDQEILIGAGDEIFFSALFTLNDANNANRFARISLIDDTSDDVLTFGEPVVGVRGVRVAADTAATGGLIADGADGSFSNGQTLWLIGRYFNSAQPGGDALELAGYDTAIAQAIPPAFDLADPNAQFAFSLAGLDIDFARITSLRFEVRGGNDNFLDEVRIGSTYAAVTVPEPVTIVLLLIGAVAVGWAAHHARPERVA
jgi:hypothetical protein